ncbi:MAG TPA: hypothetical protein VFX17_00125 [Patescibacteria group bacterium]|nr:hypothetical protein [Patescibacteria group bacterium]
MKKLIIVAGVVALIAAACNQSATQNNPNQTGNTQNPPASNTQTYSNSTYGFSFDYPNSMQFVTPTYPNLDDKVVQIQIGQDQYPGTNFGDAAFGVSTQFAKSLSDCLALTPPEGGDGFKTAVTINGTQFNMTKSNGAGAGNIYESNVYRTLHNNNCIEIDETIHTSNIGNYPAGSVTEVDSADVQAKLDDVLNSFQFSE